MEVYKSIMKMNKTCVAFGEFDCIHKGHKAVVETVVHTAKDNTLKSVIVSIPEDGAVFTTEEEKEYLCLLACVLNSRVLCVSLQPFKLSPPLFLFKGTDPFVKGKM